MSFVVLTYVSCDAFVSLLCRVIEGVFFGNDKLLPRLHHYSPVPVKCTHGSQHHTCLSKIYITLQYIYNNYKHIWTSTYNMWGSILYVCALINVYMWIKAWIKYKSIMCPQKTWIHMDYFYDVMMNSEVSTFWKNWLLIEGKKAVGLHLKNYSFVIWIWLPWVNDEN